MDITIILKNLLQNLKTIKAKNILLRSKHLPYSTDLNKYLNNFDFISEKEIENIKSKYFNKDSINIVNFNNTSYLFKLNQDCIFIKELLETKDTIFQDTNFSNFIYGNKNIKILYKASSLEKRHELIYSLINSIRSISNEIIVVIENEKLYNIKNCTNIFCFYKEALNFEDYLIHLKTIDFRYLLIPDLNDVNIINKFILNFYNKKIFMSADINLNYSNNNVQLLEEANNNKIKVSLFNEKNFYKTLNRS